jgi:pimeloyl-ACP methyl ester carboxylesterase
MQEKTIVLKGRKFHYRYQGEGPVVVLIHGFGEDGRVWKNQFNALEGYCLLVPDLPGSGGSELTDDMSMEGLAETIYEWLEQEGIRKSTHIGHSMGGYVTLAFAEKYEERLNGFGLFHSTAYADSVEKIETRQKGIKFIKEHGSWEFLKTSTPNLYSAATKSENVQIIEQQINELRNFSAEALVNYYVSMINRPERVDVLRTTELPVLFVLGRYDAAVPLNDGLTLCYLPYLSYIHILEKSGHMGMMEEVQASNQILKNYLSSIHHQTR